MDATDHENIPSPNHGAVYSNMINTGFDYLNLDLHRNKHKGPGSSNVSGFIQNSYQAPAKIYAESTEKCKPLGWFYKNLFPEEQVVKPCINSAKELNYNNENKKFAEPAKHSPDKKYILSNFDLNALSPNSW